MYDDELDLFDEAFDEMEETDTLSCLLAEYDSYGARRPVTACIDGAAWSDRGAT